MRVLVMTFHLRAPWVHSLKGKRMELRSLTSRLRNTFNVSVCEASHQGVHQMLVIGVAAFAADNAQGDSIAQSVQRYIEDHSDAELVKVEQELV